MTDPDFNISAPSEAMSQTKPKTEIHEQWKNLLDRDVLKDSIQMVALYITVFELLEHAVVSKPKDFFTIWEFDDKAHQEYLHEVISLYDPKAIPGIAGKRKDINASLLWLKKVGAIDDDDIRVYADSKKLRNNMAHQMLTFIADGGSKVVGQFASMYALFSKIERWWILEHELPISGEYTPDEVDPSGVMSGNMMVLTIILDILSSDSNARYKEVCEAFGVPVRE